MKITIAYLPEEAPKAAAVLAALRQLLPGARIRDKAAHAPFRHVYLTTPVDSDTMVPGMGVPPKG